MIATPTIRPDAAERDASLPEGASVISARHLDFHHTNGTTVKQILFGVDLDVGPGEIVMLTGPSGSGKSTLLSLIGGVRSVRHGQLIVLGQELHHAAPRVLVPIRRKIGFIFQTHNLLDFLTVRRNVEIVFEMHPEVSAADARRRSEDIIRAVGMGENLDDHPSRLSVGQRQRVAIARALVCRPELVLADEPTAALDSQSGRDGVQLLEALAREQQSAILMVTHDNRVLDLADRIASMEDGRLQSS